MQATDGVAIVCPLCQRKVGVLTPDAVTSMLPAVYDLRGKAPAERFALQHPLRRSRRAARHCRFRLIRHRAWVDRAQALAARSGRNRLYPDEVDRA